jgi:hypothetical protein
MMADETLKKQAQNNSKDNFRYEFQDAFEDKAYNVMRHDFFQYSGHEIYQ